MNEKMIDTPIFDFVKKYSESDSVRLHMPGHKGNSFLGVERLDITEIDGADVLYHSNGIIRKSEDIASSLFGSSKTVYSTEGSSLCIRAMLYLATFESRRIGKRPIIAAGRNAHKVFMTAAALLDFDINWIFPDEQTLDSVISCRISAQSLDKELSEMVQKPCAVYVTSPDYLGNVADICGMSQVCKKHGVLLIVDNAHGAYLKFLPCDSAMHPMDCGADMCCDSAHKTLPVLTGGAYLHISKSAPPEFSNMAEKAMSLFASTSPSYLILQSLDLANRYIGNGYSQKLKECSEAVLRLKQRLLKMGYCLIGDESLKLTIAPKSFGYTGTELYDILLAHGIVCEFADADYVVMMFAPENAEDACRRVESVLSCVVRKNRIFEDAPLLGKPERCMSPREALFSAVKTLTVDKCVGKILASANVSCPPAIPIVVCGEKIDEAAVRVFKYYGINTCEVVE